MFFDPEQNVSESKDSLTSSTDPVLNIVNFCMTTYHGHGSSGIELKQKDVDCE